MRTSKESTPVYRQLQISLRAGGGHATILGKHVIYKLNRLPWAIISDGVTGQLKQSDSQAVGTARVNMGSV